MLGLFDSEVELFFCSISVATLVYIRLKDSHLKRVKAVRSRKQREERLVASFQRCKPEDWRYIAEGALNLALKYVGSDEQLKGYVLRLRKDNPEASGGNTSVNPWKESLHFCEKLIVPLFGRRYVQPSIEVPLSLGFVDSVDKLIFDDRPIKRKKHRLDSKVEVGLLMLDNTSIPGLSKYPAICIEIKCKWGFIPTSQWITHPIKKRVSRFVMHQQLKLANGKLDSVSKYDPIDLFSREKPRVLHALKCLIETPQNNFRLFLDGKMVFPDTHSKGNREGLSSVFDDNPNLVKGGVNAMIDILADIIVREPLMDRIKAAQQLDEIDIEGVWPVYREIQKRGEKLSPLAEGSPILPRGAVTSLPLNPEEQHEIVRRFLLSCTAKDCSIMILLQPDESKPNSVPLRKLNLPISTEDERTVVKGYNGFTYSIAIVDLDPKPVQKMEKYYKQDQKIAQLYTELESIGGLL